MYPLGHARSTSAGLDNILAHKNKLLGDLVFSEAGAPDNFVGCLQSMESLSATVMVSIFNFDLAALLEHPCMFHVFGEGAPRRLTDLQPFYGAASHREDRSTATRQAQSRAGKVWSLFVGVHCVEAPPAWILAW